MQAGRDPMFKESAEGGMGLRVETKACVNARQSLRRERVQEKGPEERYRVEGQTMKENEEKEPSAVAVTFVRNFPPAY